MPRPTKIVWLLMYSSFCDEKTPPLVIIRFLTMSESDMIMKSWLPSHIEYKFPNFLAQWSRASSGYCVRKGNEPEWIVSPVQQDRRQRLRLTHDGQGPWAIRDLVPLLVHQNTTEKLFEQQGETGSGYDSKGDNRSNKIWCSKWLLGGGMKDIETTLIKHREAICRIGHLKWVKGQMFQWDTRKMWEKF